MPPSGTLTVVVTVTNEKVGNCTVTPSVVVVCVVGLGRRCRRRLASASLVFFVVVVEPVNVNLLTSPIWLKNGTTVSRTKRRSLRDDGLHGQERAFGEHHDHRLLGGGEVAHDRDHADHERRLRRVATRTPAGR